jgi:arginase family enzyme
VKTTVVIFPFDLFGSGGAGAGAALVGDELREILADNRREQVVTRARCYTDMVRLREFAFDDLDAVASWRERGRQAVRQVLRQGDFLVWVAGNHLGALPVYDELSAAGPGELVVQFDAHLDVHHFADCATEPSHGNFLLHCAGPLPPLVNAGHRELLLPTDHIGKYYQRTFSAAELAVDAAPAMAALTNAASAARRVWIDIDWDVLDVAYFPAVARPVPFGLAPPLLLRLLEAVWTPKVGGVLLSEFDPGRDRDDRSLAVVTWLLEYLLLRRYEAGELG